MENSRKIHIDIRYFKNYSLSLIIKDMKIKTTETIYLIIVKKSITVKEITVRYGKWINLTHCWWK